MVNAGVPHTLPSPGNPSLVGPSLAIVTQFIFPPPNLGADRGQGHPKLCLFWDLGPDCKRLEGHLIPPRILTLLLSQDLPLGERNTAERRGGVRRDRRGTSSVLPEPRAPPMGWGGTGGEMTLRPLLSLGCVSKGRGRRR